MIASLVADNGHPPARLAGELEVRGPLIVTSSVTPDQLAAGETAVLTPAAASSVIVLSSAGVAFLCGLAAGREGEIRTLVNDGLYAITLGHEETSTIAGAAVAASARWSCPDSIPFVMRPKSCIPIRYSGSRWQLLASNVFAPNGVILPQSLTEIHERIGVAPTKFWPAGHPSDLVLQGTPLMDFHMGGYKGVKISSGSGWKADVSAPGVNSIFRAAIFAQAAHDAADNLITGRTDAAGVQSNLRVATVTDKFQFNLYDGVDLVTVEVNKVVIDGVVRLGIGQLSKDTNLARARLSTRGEAAVASADANAAAIGNLNGAGGFNYVGGDGLTGAAAATLFGGCFEIIGATAAPALLPAIVSHRLGME